MRTQPDMDQLAINTIRMLVGGCGAEGEVRPSWHADGCGPTAYTLWQRVLRYDPADPGWINRDRFVLSSGHASMLLYSLIHLAGIKAANPSYEAVGREAVRSTTSRRFARRAAAVPGHPEYGWTSGVETTTGPLGQGVATSVGMAIAGQWLSATYNRPGFDLFDFNIYALCGDGDMMEGVSSEAASLAGHLRLSNLCWIYDSNRVTIEGHTDIAFTEDVAARFLAYGWNVPRVTDANDMELLERAYHGFLRTEDRPTLIIVHSHIGYGAPAQAGFAGSARRAARRGGSAADQGVLRLRSGSGLRGPDGVREHFAAQLGARGAQLARRVARHVRALPRRVSGPGRTDRSA